MGWFGVRIVLECVIPDDAAKKVFEDKVIVVSASSEQEAESRGRQFGREAEHQYANSDGQPVSWVFREVLDVCSLSDDGLRDGSEVYYHFVGEADLDAIRASLRPGRLG